MSILFKMQYYIFKINKKPSTPLNLRSCARLCLECGAFHWSLFSSLRCFSWPVVAFEATDRFPVISLLKCIYTLE